MDFQNVVNAIRLAEKIVVLAGEQEQNEVHFFSFIFNNVLNLKWIFKKS